MKSCTVSLMYSNALACRANLLMSILQPFLFATKAVSASSRALVHDVIPYIDILTRHVDQFRRDDSLSPMVRAAAKCGRQILDKYHSRTDETIIFRVAMGMFHTWSGARKSHSPGSVAPWDEDPVFSRTRVA